jgi:hypothetical protein
VRLRLVQQTPEYEVRWAPFDNNAGTAGAIRATLDTVQSRAAIPPDVWGPSDAFGFRYAVATIATHQPGFPHWSKPVLVTIRDRNGLVDVVGMNHHDRATGIGRQLGKMTRVRRWGHRLVGIVTLLAGFSYLTTAPEAVENFRHVGYPQQLRVLLGIAKLAGAIVLLVPRLPTLKESYAGFTFMWIAAVVAHYLAGDGALSLLPVA